MRYIRQLAQETNGEVVYGLGRQPAVLRTFSQRLSRYVDHEIKSNFSLLCLLFDILSILGFLEGVLMMRLMALGMMGGLQCIVMARKILSLLLTLQSI